MIIWPLAHLHKEPRHSGAGRNPEESGTEAQLKNNSKFISRINSRGHLNDGGIWIPACAGMTEMR